jgi:hypothetical protein
MRAAFHRFVRVLAASCCVLLSLGLGISGALADSNAGIFNGAVSSSKLRNGDITFDDIPNMIVAVTEWVLGLAATIAVFAIIFGALKLTLGSGALGGSDGKTDAKNALQYGITGFVVAVSGWLIVQFVLSNL